MNLRHTVNAWKARRLLKHEEQTRLLNSTKQPVEKEFDKAADPVGFFYSTKSDDRDVTEFIESAMPDPHRARAINPYVEIASTAEQIDSDATRAAFKAIADLRDGTTRDFDDE